mgnify:CR=1 FL=1
MITTSSTPAAHVERARAAAAAFLAAHPDASPDVRAHYVQLDRKVERLLADGHPRSAEHWLSFAELMAGLITFADWHAVRAELGDFDLEPIG